MRKKLFYKKLIAISNQLEEKYLSKIRTKKSDFTRRRKITVKDIFLQMFFNKGKAQKNEIYDFYGEVNQDMSVSTTAFVNARMKFNPEALLLIMQDLIKEEYATPDNLITLNGYFIMAVDGSDFVFPSTEKNKEKYGEASGDKYGNAKTMSSISTFFDCINKVFVDVSINEYKCSERKSAINHLEKSKQILPKNAKTITIFDRGYVGIQLIDQMIDNNQKFLMRLPKGIFSKEREKLGEGNQDRIINVKYDSPRSNQFRNDKAFRYKLLNTEYELRFVNIQIVNEKGETSIISFATNLSEEEFDTNGIKELYHIRWDIETGYRALKSQMNVEDFSGYRDVLVRQDIYTSVFVYNTVSLTIAEQEEISKTPEDRYKYDMKTNRNFAIGVLKTDLLKIFVLYDNKKASKKARKRFEKNIVKYSCPVRKGRSYERIKKGINKSKLSYRRSY